MFSHDIEEENKQAIALEQFSDIKDVCAELRSEAFEQDFFDQSNDRIKEEANDFIRSFASKNGMNAHTVRPRAWSFGIGDQQLFQDGIIELYFDNNDIAFFSYVDVSGSKITDKH